MRGLLLGASLVSLCASSWANAAEAPEVAELVVTGEKTERPLQETVTSVAVATAQRLEAENIQTFFDLAGRTANVSLTYGPSGFSIRGIDNLSPSGGGSGGLATVYLDGAPLPDRGLGNGPLDTWDVGQIEILRGPQSTLQGRNALAGAVAITTVDPTWDWSFRARARVTDENEHAFAVAGGGPIVADQVAFRIAAEARESDGFIYNTTRHELENDLSAETVRAKLLLTPAALPGLTARIGWLHDEREGGYLFSYARTDVPDPFDTRVSTGDYPNTSNSITDIVTAKADYDLSERLTLTGVASWTRVDNTSTFDGDAGPEPFAFGIQDELDETFTQEIRLAYRGERLEGLLGAYHSKRENDYAVVSRTRFTTPEPTLVAALRANGVSAATAALAARLYVAALPRVTVDFAGAGPLTVETYALFGDGRLQLTPKLSLLGGFRYDREENRNGGVQQAAFAGVYPNPGAFGALAPLIAGLNQAVGAFVAEANAEAAPESRTFEAFLPKLGAKYDLSDDASVSFVVQRGYRSGGSTVNLARSAVVPYDPEYTWNYELALRTAWPDQRLTFNANAFYIDWTDQQVTVNLGRGLYDFQTENAGKSHLYGFEMEAAWRPAEALDVYGSVGHTRTHFDDFTVATGLADADLSGTEFRFAPRWTLAAGVNYRFADGFIANVNANYRSKAFAAAGADQQLYAIKARTLVNARLGFEAEHWSASVFADNLFDETYVQYPQPTMNRAILGDPRVIGAVLETRW
jgi:iron complex outermembrane recepter protein